VATRPEPLLLDEPVAALDPLARRELLQGLTEVVADQQASVILSSHPVSDLERVCDYPVVPVDSRVRVAGAIDELVASHHRPSGPRRERGTLPGDLEVLGERHTDKQTTLVVRADGQILDPPWTVEQLDREDLVLAYMPRAVTQDRWPRVEVRS
jgi:ABC-2 type transport system ATP-binding protein